MKDQLAKARATATESTETVVKQATSQFNIAYVDPLTPEQLAVSMMQATGRVNQLRGGEAARINKAKPLSEEDKKDPAKVAARDAEIQEAVRAAADRVLAGEESVIMDGMNPYERHLAHTAIREMEGVASQSVGEGRDRRVEVIAD